ncbi:hypothetical protein [Paenibacillus sp. FSL P2-0136]
MKGEDVTELGRRGGPEGKSMVNGAGGERWVRRAAGLRRAE